MILLSQLYHQKSSSNSIGRSSPAARLLFRCLALAALLIGGADLVTAQDEDKLQTEQDIKTLKEHNVDADAESLLKLFRQHTLTDQDVKNINLWLGQLGSASYNEREKAVAHVIEAGPTALPQLRRLLTHGDQETYLRAKRCIEAIEGKLQPEIYNAAARLLQRMNPPQACPVLFSYLPYSVNGDVRDTVLGVLWKIGVNRGTINPVLVKGLSDARPACRAAAALIVAKAGDAEHRKLAAKLLVDPDPRVRFCTAHGLLLARDVGGVPVLLLLLREGPYDLAQKAEEVFFLAAGDTAPDVHLRNDVQSRQQSYAAWKLWWKQSSKKLAWEQLDESLPWLKSGRAARRVAELFMKSLFEGDLENLKKATGFPFVMRPNGQMTFQNWQQFHQLVGQAAVGIKQRKLTFKILKAYTAKNYVRSVKAKAAQYLKPFELKQMFVVAIVVNHPDRAESGALLVRRIGGQAKVVGLMED